MDYTFDFTIKGDGISSLSGAISVPVENGYANIGRFRPYKILNKNVNLPLLKSIQSLESVEDFKKDCFSIINYLDESKADLGEIKNFVQALQRLIDNHVNRFGRIFIDDLMSYIDAYSYILHGLGLPATDIEKEYPIYLYVFIRRHLSQVFEAFNHPITGANITFRESVRYTNLENYVNSTYPHLLD